MDIRPDVGFQKPVDVSRNGFRREHTSDVVGGIGGLFRDRGASCKARDKTVLQHLSNNLFLHGERGAPTDSILADEELAFRSPLRSNPQRRAGSAFGQLACTQGKSYWACRRRREKNPVRTNRTPKKTELGRFFAIRKFLTSTKSPPFRAGAQRKSATHTHTLAGEGS